MVLVPMSEENPVHAIALRKQPAEVGVPDVDAHVVVGEGRAAINDDDAVRLLKREAIHADLAQAAEGDDSNPIGR